MGKPLQAMARAHVTMVSSWNPAANTAAAARSTKTPSSRPKTAMVRQAAPCTPCDRTSASPPALRFTVTSTQIHRCICDRSLAVAPMAITGRMHICQRPNAHRAAPSRVFIVRQTPRCRRLTLMMATGATRRIPCNYGSVRGVETGAPVVVGVMLDPKGMATVKSASTGPGTSAGTRTVVVCKTVD